MLILLLFLIHSRNCSPNLAWVFSVKADYLEKTMHCCKFECHLSILVENVWLKMVSIVITVRGAWVGIYMSSSVLVTFILSCCSFDTHSSVYKFNTQLSLFSLWHCSSLIFPRLVDLVHQDLSLADQFSKLKVMEFNLCNWPVHSHKMMLNLQF